MSTVNDRLFNERVARFKTLESIKAPSVILTREARLIFEAGSGGRWRAVWAIFSNSVRVDFDWYVFRPVRHCLHGLGFCYRDADGVCVICDNGGPDE